MNQENIPSSIVLKGNGYTYLLKYSTDVQYSFENEIYRNEYFIMKNKVFEMVKTISVLGKKKPLPIHKNYEVWGTDYFTWELPKNWSLKNTSQQGQFFWSILEGENRIGSIEMILKT